MHSKKSEYTTEEFESNVNKGMVLGKNGDWCSIDEAINEAINKEKEFHVHLENGEVLHNGDWIPIIEAIAFESAEVKKSNKGKKENGIKIGTKNDNKVKKDSLSKKENKILLADVNIKVDKTKKTDFKEDVFKPELKLSESKTTVSKAKNMDPVIIKETSIKGIKPKSEHKIIGNENEINKIDNDNARTQIIEKFPPKSQKAIISPPKPDFISSDKPLIKKLSKETSTPDESITQVIPLSVHIFKGKQIKSRRGNMNSQIEKNKSLPDESLDDWAKIRTNFIKNTILFSASALLVFICFFILYYFVIL